MRLSRFPALLFDFDGTLIDSAPEIGAALNLLLGEEGLAPVEVSAVRGMVGDGAARLVAQGFGARGISLTGSDLAAMTDRYVAHYAKVPADAGCIYPGVMETLLRLRAGGHVLALCTNKPEAITRSLLPELGMEGLFEAVVGGDTLPQRKPDPAPVRHALAQLGFAPAQAVMVGDGINDVLSGRAGGLKTIAVSYGYPRMAPADLGADILIDHFEELPAALDRLVQRC